MLIFKAGKLASTTPSAQRTIWKATRIIEAWLADKEFLLANQLPKTVSCPVELALEVLAGKWKPVVLAHLKESPLRYGELRARIPRLSDKILTERLRDLEDRGLVRRRRVQGPPRYVIYELTESGESLRPILEALYAWGEMAAPTLGVKVEMSARPSQGAASDAATR